MAHPQQFDDHDLVLAEVRAICLSLPGADEKISHGRPNFFTKKVFAVYGGVVKGDHHSGRFDQSMLFLPDPDELPAFDQDDRFFFPAYYGPSGWRGLDLSDRDRIDWDEVAELAEESFRNTASKKLIAALDPSGSDQPS
jgi:uncharacterized protein YdhG (YjbR/CyaY superfamily)